MIKLIYELYRYLAQHRIVAGNIKITVEFLDPNTQFLAEYLLKTQALGIFADHKTIEGICEGKPLQVFGINFQVKRFEYPKPPVLQPPGCGCSSCEAARANAAFRK